MATSSSPVPPALRDALAAWDSRGRPAQLRMDWSLRAWQGALPEHADFLATMPGAVGRAEIAELCKTAPRSPEDAVRGFVAAMVWGFGRVGYGPFRTARVLSENPGAKDALHEVAQVAVREGGPAAFSAMRQRRLKWLGVAFATKYLFFCAANGSATPAPVLDRLVRRWLGEHTGWAPRLDWRDSDYTTYVEMVCTWAAELGLSAANVELLMFSSSVAGDPTSQWQSPIGAAGGPAVSEPADVPSGAASVLEALEDAGEMFAGLPDLPNEDIEDFERGLRDLRRIVLRVARA